MEESSTLRSCWRSSCGRVVLSCRGCDLHNNNYQRATIQRQWRTTTTTYYCIGTTATTTNTKVYYSPIWNSGKSALLVSNSSEIGGKQNWMSWTITVNKVARFRTLWRTYLNYLFYVLAAQTSASQEGAKFKTVPQKVWKNNSRL